MLAIPARGLSCSVFEELVEDDGSCNESEHPLILILRPDAAAADIESHVLDLEILTRTAGAKTLVEKLREMPPTFVPATAHRSAP